MDWFRLYHEARTDRKLESLSDAEHRTWFNLICFASEQRDNRGEIRGYDLDLLAIEVARADVDALKLTLDHLRRLRIISVDADRIVFLNFTKRQYSKPSDLPEAVSERVTKHRAAKRNAIIKDEHAVKRDVTPSNATEAEAEAEAEADTESDSTKVTNVTFAADAASKERTLTLQQKTWAVLRDELEYEPSRTNDGERGSWNKAIRGLLKESERPETIPELVGLYHARWPGIDCTPMALLNKLALIRSPPPKVVHQNGRASDRAEPDLGRRNYVELLQKKVEREKAEKGGTNVST